VAQSVIAVGCVAESC